MTPFAEGIEAKAMTVLLATTSTTITAVIGFLMTTPLASGRSFALLAA